jgi:hypothetical protein
MIPVLGAALLFSDPAAADSAVIKYPGRHPNYSFEAEPHMAVGLYSPGPSHDGFGLGFRGTVQIVDNGFVKTINNSVGIGFGLDWLHYDDDECYRFRGDLICGDDYDYNLFWIPVVMQWNFWLSENWSVFAEPGLSIRLNDERYFNDHIDIDPTLFIGGRFALSDDVTLTMRLGHPTFTFGVSFLL